MEDRGMKAKWYVGINFTDGKKPVAFKSMAYPTAGNSPGFRAVVGPFVTKRGAIWAAGQYGNPHYTCVGDAERIAKSIA
jgi:hypothetical protein